MRSMLRIWFRTTKKPLSEVLRGLLADEFVNDASRTCLARGTFRSACAAAVEADASNGQRKSNDNSNDNA